MTRKHFEELAWNLRRAHADYVETLPLESDERHAADRAWDCAALAVAEACGASNYRFDRGLFLRACGYSHRPDGSMVPVRWTDSGRLAGYR